MIRADADQDRDFFRDVIGNWTNVQQVARKLADRQLAQARDQFIEIVFSPRVDARLSHLGQARFSPLSAQEQDEFWAELLKPLAVAA